MSTLANLMTLLTLDNSDFVAGLDAADQAADSAAAKIGQKFSDIGAGMTSAGTKLTTGVALPVIGAGLVAVNYASDLDETRSKVGEIFGEMSGDVNAWAGNANLALGQTQQQALDGASDFAIFGKAAQMSGQDLVDFSTSNVELASDLSSFFNSSPEEAITAIGAAYRGESEPIRRYGVMLNEATVKQQALQMGIWDGEGALTQQQRVMAVNASILAQTTAAQGDFARTSEGLANSTRIAKAQLVDAAAALGMQLLPYAQQAVHWVSALVGKFQNLSPEAQRVILVVAGIAAAIGPLLIVIGSLMSAIGGIVTFFAGGTAVALAPVVLPILAIIAALGLLYVAWQNNWGGIQEKTAAFLAWITPAWNLVWGGIVAYFQFVWAQIKTIYEAFAAAFQGDWYTFGAKLREAWDRGWKAIVTVLSNAGKSIGEKISSLVTSAKEKFTNTDWGAVGKNIIRAMGNGMLSMLGWIADKARSVAQAAVDAAKGFLGIHSDSRVFGSIGRYSASGFGNYFLDEMDKFTPKMNVAMVGSLQPAPVGVGGDVNIAPRNVDLGNDQAQGEGAAGDPGMMREIYKMLRDLPDTIARANRDAFEKARRE